jgi:hypothetical protein
MFCRGVRPDLRRAVGGLAGGGVRLGERSLSEGWCRLGLVPRPGLMPRPGPNLTSCRGLGPRVVSVSRTTELGRLKTGRTDVMSSRHHGQGGLLVRDSVNSCNKNCYTRKPPHKLTSTQGQQKEWPQLIDTGSVKASSWHKAQATSPAAIISRQIRVSATAIIWGQVETGPGKRPPPAAPPPPPSVPAPPLPLSSTASSARPAPPPSAPPPPPPWRRPGRPPP